MEIRSVSDSLIDKTSAFASDVFVDYYNPLIGNDQAVYMADLFLSPDAIRKLINEGAVFRIVSEGDEILAFCEYQKEDERLFLSKLYVRKDLRGRGLGRLMFEDVLSYAKKNGLSAVFLTVNKGNTPSYELYLHLGFRVIDSVVNDIGHGYVMDDYIMEYRIDE